MKGQVSHDHTYRIIARTPEACRQAAIAENQKAGYVKFPAFGFRTVKHSSSADRNTCFMYTPNLGKFVSGSIHGESNDHHLTGCIKPGQRLKTGCVDTPANPLVPATVDVVAGFPSVANNNVAAGKSRTPEDCRQESIAGNGKYVGWGFRNSENNAKYTNTCFLLKRMPVFEGDSSDVLRVAGCNNPNERVSLGCETPGKYVYGVHPDKPRKAAYVSGDGKFGYGDARGAVMDGTSTMRISGDLSTAECNIGALGGSYALMPDVYPGLDGYVTARPAVQGCGRVSVANAEIVKGNVVQISVSRDMLWGVDATGNVYHCSQPCVGDWRSSGFEDASSVSVGTKSVHVVKSRGVNGGDVYRRKTPFDADDQWVKVAGGINYVSEGRTWVYLINWKNDIYVCKVGGCSDARGWRKIRGVLVQAETRGEDVWGVARSGNLYRSEAGSSAHARVETPEPLAYVTLDEHNVFGWSISGKLFACKLPCVDVEWMQPPGFGDLKPTMLPLVGGPSPSMPSDLKLDYPEDTSALPSPDIDVVPGYKSGMSLERAFYYVSRTPEACRRTAQAENEKAGFVKYPAFLFRTVRHNTAKLQNTCSLYTSYIGPFAGYERDIAHVTGCVRPGLRVATGCAEPTPSFSVGDGNLWSVGGAAAADGHHKRITRTAFSALSFTGKDVSVARVVRFDTWVVPRFVPGNPLSEDEMSALGTFAFDRGVVCGDLMRPDGVKPIPSGCYTHETKMRLVGTVDKTWRVVVVVVLRTGAKLVLETLPDSWDPEKFGIGDEEGSTPKPTAEDFFAAVHTLHTTEEGEVEAHRYGVEGGEAAKKVLYRNALKREDGAFISGPKWGFTDAVHIDAEMQEVTVNAANRDFKHSTWEDGTSYFGETFQERYNVRDPSDPIPILTMVAMLVPPSGQMLTDKEKSWLEEALGGGVDLDVDAEVCYDSINDDAVPSLTNDVKVANSRSQRLLSSCDYKRLNGRSNMLLLMAVLSNGKKVAAVTSTGFKPMVGGATVKKDGRAQLFEMTERLVFSTKDDQWGQGLVIQPDTEVKYPAVGFGSPKEADLAFSPDLMGGRCVIGKNYRRTCEGNKKDTSCTWTKCTKWAFR